ncbi:hypothetical protein Belba_1304 [Belliella baltica DSM 15883]|jgi:hypothetical protein|uniref:Uncharacterized protein n=1 Tax=Belliella baltica (strain DSM 15883 / CIP 108006 / LMG 21964 / BA134) TaxID=866536 RepID=I3Z3W3_BELBD|nr:hypothetical protein [Belliella baltica]AFL83931.1 hypothetical protein Belba_1304 [Belliella baltica DSM 15883]
MKSESKNIQISRKKFLGLSLTLPFLNDATSLAAEPARQQAKDDEFITMLTADGKAVRVRKDAVKNAKVIEKKMSNQSLLNWLKPKDFTK